MELPFFCAETLKFDFDKRILAGIAGSQPNFIVGEIHYQTEVGSTVFNGHRQGQGRVRAKRGGIALVIPQCFLCIVNR